MNTRSLPLTMFLSALFTGIVLPATADDGGSPLLSAPKVRLSSGQPDVQVATRAGGRYKGADYYSPRSSAKQRLSRKVSSKTITSYFKVENDSRSLPGPSHSLFSVSGSGSDQNFAVTYFTEKGANITTSVLRGQYVLNIAADSGTILRQRIAPGRANAPTGAKGRFAVKAVNKRESLTDMAETEATKR